MTYYAGSHTRGGRTEPTRRYARKSSLTLAELIEAKKVSVARAETELRNAIETGNEVYILGAQHYLESMQSGLEAMQAEQEAGR